jgi:CRISPR-associated protein Csm1
MMEALEHLALAALLWDIPGVLADAPTEISPAAQRLLDLTRLQDQPVSAAILAQARQYAGSSAQPRSGLPDQPLRAIFGQVQISRQQSLQPSYYPIAPLPATHASLEVLVPRLEPDMSGVAAHLQNLARELDWLGTRVDCSRFAQVYPHLLVLLQRYGGCLPGGSPDVSLCDTARLTSAIAVCLYQYHADQMPNTDIQAEAQSERFCLLAGQLTAVPDYLCDITHAGPGGGAQRLRARALYLQTLVDLVGQQVAWQFGVPDGNLIMATGNTFYLLLPNRDDVTMITQGLRHTIDTWLQQHCNGEIGLSLAHLSFAGEQFQASSSTQPGFGDLLNRLQQRLQREAQRRAHAVLTSDNAWDEAAFLLPHNFQATGVCAGCGKFPAAQPDSLCRQCAQDLAWGRQLPQARYIAYYQGYPEAADLTADLAARPLPFNCAVRLLSAAQLADAGEPYQIVQINDPQIHDLADYPATFRYLATHIPIGPDSEPLTFAAITARARGRALLGYLDAGLDDLTLLLTEGLRRDSDGYDTIARIATLSRRIDQFFSGWLQQRLSQPPAGTEQDYRDCYTVFSGGDACLLVGPWDRVADLACAVRNQLARFVGDNPDITMSAGIRLTPEDYPPAQAARDTREAHTQATFARKTDDPEQIGDQLTLLGDTMPWDEAQRILAQIALLQPGVVHLTATLLGNLVEYGRLYRLWMDTGAVEGLHYKARFAYAIARALRKGHPAVYQWADTLLQSLHTSQPDPSMQHLELIATYLLYIKPQRSST